MATVTAPRTQDTTARFTMLARVSEALRPFGAALLRALSAWAV